jgi:hypothetical protein
MNTCNKKLVLLLFVTLIVWLLGGSCLAADQGDVDRTPYGVGVNMHVVGYNDMQGRPSYMPHVQKQGSRYILYASEHVGTGAYLNPMNGQMEYDGTSIIDVTNPHHPIYLHHLPSLYGPPNNERRHIRVCAGDDLPGKLYPGKYFAVGSDGQVSHTLWDVTDPANPVLISKLIDNLTYTHKESWDCESGYIAMPKNSATWHSSGAACTTSPGGGCNIAIFDLHDPYNPKYITDWGLVGQTPGSTVTPKPAMVHETVISTDPVYGTRLYGAYGISVSGDGWLQVADLSKILALGHPVTTDADILAGQLGVQKMSYEFGMHSFWPFLHIPMADFAQNYPPAAGPVPGNTNPLVQDFGLASTEGTNNGCVGWRAIAWVVDLNYPSEPQTVANIQIPALQGKGEFDFCANDARFGSHGISEDLYPPFKNRFNAIAWFSGGVRVWDLRNPFQPKEVAWFVPNPNQNTEQNCATRNGVTTCSNTIGTNNAATDDRGYVYAVDRYGTGAYVFELTGKARDEVFNLEPHHHHDDH